MAYKLLIFTVDISNNIFDIFMVERDVDEAIFNRGTSLVFMKYSARFRNSRLFFQFEDVKITRTLP